MFLTVTPQVPESSSQYKTIKLFISHNFNDLLLIYYLKNNISNFLHADLISNHVIILLSSVPMI